MNIIKDKIWNSKILDSEIIQEIESAKYKDPGFDINLADNNNHTLLLCACVCNREKLVEYLLADPNIIVQRPRFILCCTFKLDILKLLLGHRNINVNIQNEDGCTGLHHACERIDYGIVRELLLDARIDIMIRDRWGITALDNAISWKRREAMIMLRRVLHTTLLRIPNKALCRDIVRMMIEEYM